MDAKAANVTFRLTNEDDLESIKSISSGLSPELDYIVESYSSLIKDPLFFGAVAEVSGESVAFGVGTIQLEGRKVYNRSSRVKTGWRNKGILGSLKKFLRETLRDKFYPQLQYEEFTTHDTNPAIQKIIDNPEYTEVYRSPFLTYELDCSPNLDDGFDQSVEEIGLDGIRLIMENADLREKFFPVRIFVGYVDFEPVPSELELIRKHNPFVLSSYNKADGQMCQLTIGVKITSKIHVIHWMISPNMDTGSTISSFKNHLRTQFQKIQKLTNDGTCVIICPQGYKEIVEATTLDLNCSVIQAQAAEFIGFRRKF